MTDTRQARPAEEPLISAYDEPEIDESHFDNDRKVSDLWEAASVVEVLHKYGYAPDDRVTRNDQVMMFRNVHEAISRKKKELLGTGRYSDVKPLEENLQNIEVGFRKLQMRNVEQDQQKQQVYCSQAKKKIVAGKTRALETSVQKVESACSAREQSLKRLHQIQRDNLELELSWDPTPRVKYSNKYLELKNAEDKLIRLHQYDDAHVVHKMLEQLRPKEEADFYAAHEERQELRRASLRKRQERDVEKMVEMTTKMRIQADNDKRAKVENVKAQITNAQLQMTHGHRLTLLKKPELSERPSAHWERRAHHNGTAATLRGEQLMDRVKGKKRGDAVAVASLSALHSFGDASLDGTLTLTRPGERSGPGCRRTSWLD